MAFTRGDAGARQAYPDTLIGTDSHTTMINGLGVVGWGVGGIEAEAAMLGQPVTMLIPQVVGFKLLGALPEGTTATDLVLTVVQVLRERGVVGKFVEFNGDGLAHLPLTDRATIANMAPEYGATCGIFLIDDESLRYLHLSGRSPEQVALVEQYYRAQGMFREDGDPDADYSDTLTLDMTTVEPSIAGPRRPQDRIALSRARSVVGDHIARHQDERADSGGQDTEADRRAHRVRRGARLRRQAAAPLRGTGAHRHAQGVGVRRTRRDPALRAPPARRLIRAGDCFRRASRCR